MPILIVVAQGSYPMIGNGDPSGCRLSPPTADKLCGRATGLKVIVDTRTSGNAIPAIHAQNIDGDASEIARQRITQATNLSRQFQVD